MLSGLKNLLLGKDFPHYLQDCKVFEGDGFFQFTHIFYDAQVVKSKYFDKRSNRKSLIIRRNSVIMNVNINVIKLRLV